jgi:hypothetical protein
MNLVLQCGGRELAALQKFAQCTVLCMHKERLLGMLAYSYRQGALYMVRQLTGQE